MYAFGNILILVQNWIGKSKSNRAKLEKFKHVNIIINALLATLVIGAVIVVIGLFFVFRVHWLLAILLLVIGEPFFAKRMLD